jgi:energy-coupling factor transport system ATP-binding protein
MENKPQEMVEFTARQEGRYRWVAIAALLLAIGTILRLVSPNVGGVTPNWTIAMYCIAINLVRPTISQAAGIGLVAGAIGVVTSKSAFPYGNLVSEVVGAVVCALMVKASLKMQLGRFNFRPAVCGALSTLASGFTFVTILKFVMAIPTPVYLYAMLPVVVTIAALNTVITQVLYFPAQKLLASRSEN